MIDQKIEVKGLKELEQQLKKFDKDIIKQATSKAALEAMRPVLARAKSRVPVSSGNLKESVKISSGSSRGRANNRVGWAVVKAGGKGKRNAQGKLPGDYVLSVHYGSSENQFPNPFLLESFLGHQTTILADYRAELSRQVSIGITKMAKRKEGK